MGSPPEHDESAALEVAARALRLRDVSEAALERKLAAAGIDEPVRRLTLDRLGEAGLVDDTRLARLRASSLAAKGHGDAAIDARLEAAGIGRDARREALAELEPEGARARTLAASRPALDRRKLAALLARRGFTDESVESALTALDDPGGGTLR